MISSIFNLPANPYRDVSKPTYITIGDVLGATVLTLAVIGSVYSTLEYGDDALEWIKDSFVTEQDVQQDVSKSMVRIPKIG